ncbi:MAG: O-antigen ligase family protein [Gammaproteobacteria bacterium]|nr:O-antigen ligase family protein [Gammaproteobacteria bacterium]
MKADKTSVTPLVYFIIASALVAFPSAILVTDVVSGLIGLVVLVLAMYTAVTQSAQLIPLMRQEKLFYIAVSLLFLTAILTSVVQQVELSRADRFINLILAIPVYLLFKSARINEKYIWLGLLAGTLIAFCVGLYQVFGASQQARATGTVHPIIFGDLSLMMGVLSLAGLDWFRRHHKVLIFIPVLAFVAGLAASVLSLSRGGWVALPFLSVVLIVYLMRYLSLKKVILVCMLAVLGVGTVYLMPQSGVQQRVQVTVTNINGYLSSESIKDPARATSIGARFEMLQAAIDIFKQHPVLGSGWGEYNDMAQDLVEQGLYNETIALFSHPHNQFLSALAKGGLFAFIALILLFFWPALIFFHYLKQPHEPEKERAALAGMLLLVGFIGFSLSEAILERSRSVIFFSFYLAVFMSVVLREKQATGSSITESSSSVNAV